MGSTVIVGNNREVIDAAVFNTHVRVGGLDVPLSPKDFYFDNLRRSYNGKFQDPEYRKAYDEETRLVENIIKPQEIPFSLDSICSEEKNTNHTKIEVLFQFLQMAELEQHAYFLSQKKSRYVSLGEAHTDYCHLDCEQKVVCSQCPRQTPDEVCCFSKAYRRQFEYDQKGTLTYHALLQMHNDEIMMIQRHFGLSYEDCLKKFALEKVTLRGGTQTTRAEIFYSNFQTEAKKNLEDRYITKKAEDIITEKNNGSPGNNVNELHEIVSGLIPELSIIN